MIKNIVFLPGWSFKAGIWKKQEEYFASLGFNTLLCELDGIESCLRNIELDRTVVIAWSLGWFKFISVLERKKKLPFAVVVVSAALGFKKSLLRMIIRDFKKDAKSLLLDFNQWLFSGSEKHASLLEAEQEFIIANRRDDREKLLEDLFFLRDIRPGSRLFNLDIPFLLIAGKRDLICPVAEVEKLKQRLSRARLKILDSGHVPFVTNVHEFNKVVEEALFEFGHINKR